MLSMFVSSICFANWRWNRARSLKVAFNCQSVAMAARDSNSAALLKHSGTVVMGIGLAFPGYASNGRQGDGWAAPITSAGASRLSGHGACRVLDFGVFTLHAICIRLNAESRTRCAISLAAGRKTVKR